jgi:DUF4097 and DUF4098 domain-containing protein YvlB
MKFKRHTICGILAFAALTFLASSSFARDTVAEGSFDRTLKVTGAVDLDVSTGSGGITVRTGESSTVRVYAKIRVNDDWRNSRSDAEAKVHRIETNPPIQQNGNTITIGRIDDEDLRRNVSISYELTVPAETRLHSTTGSGSQTIEGIRGPLEASTGSGSLRISRIDAETQCHTGSGGIEVDDIKGSVRASTGSGHIRATRVAGSFSGHTGSGSIEAEQTAGGDADVDTGSGTITLRGTRGRLTARTGSGSITADGEMTGDWRLHTSSGTVRVRLPEKAAFELDAHTSSGSIHTNRQILVQGTLNRRELRGKVGAGGPVLDVSTSSGSIEIE